MKDYNVVLFDGTQLVINAARFVTDGMGTRFFDAAGETVAAWSDGMVKAVWPVPAS